MSMATKALGLCKSNPSAAQVTCSLRQYGGSMIGGIERLVKKGALTGYCIGTALTAVGLITVYKVAEKIAKDEDERLKRIRRRSREQNRAKKAVETEVIENAEIIIVDKENFDTANIQE